MADTDRPAVYEIAVRGCASVDEALALQEPIARLLCPEPDHAGPCPVPWEFGLADGPGPDGPGRDEAGPDALLVGVYASRAEAAGVAARVRELAGAARPVSLTEGVPARFPALRDQVRAERGQPE